MGAEGFLLSRLVQRWAQGAWSAWTLPEEPQLAINISLPHRLDISFQPNFNPQKVETNQ